MPSQAPISHHLDLYAYWEAKRAGRTMPSRGDLDPAEITSLLPYVVLIEKAGVEFWARLVGSAIVRELGYDETGKILGSHLPDPKSALDAHAIFDRVFTCACPVLATGAFIFKSGSSHNMSLLVLPLSEDGANVNMAIASLVARSRLTDTSRGWLKDIPARLCGIHDVRDGNDLERRCIEWERERRPASSH